MASWFSERGRRNGGRVSISVRQLLVPFLATAGIVCFSSAEAADQQRAAVTWAGVHGAESRAPGASVKGVAASGDVALVAEWIMQNHRNGGFPFVIADKANGRLYAFHENGELFAEARALYGAMRSDVMTQEQADKALRDLSVSDMITPAGIFNAQPYESRAYGPAVRFARFSHSNLLIHRAPIEWRRRYLDSSRTGRNRVTYGCINVLPKFMDETLLPALRRGAMLVVLPETQSARSFFGIAINNGGATAPL